MQQGALSAALVPKVSAVRLRMRSDRPGQRLMIRYVKSWRLTGVVVVAINGSDVATLTSKSEGKYTLPEHSFHDLAAPGEFELVLRTAATAQGGGTTNFGVLALHVG